MYNIFFFGDGTVIAFAVGCLTAEQVSSLAYRVFTRNRQQTPSNQIERISQKF